MKLKFDNLTKAILLFVLAFGFSSLAMAQRTITGVVTDATTGDPLIGANILVVGTSSGTITDVDGSYSLQVPAGATELEVTYTGYGASRVTIGASNSLDVQLAAGALLEEVVVTGYGTQKAKEVTSSITSVKAEDFNQGQVNNPLQLVQGKVAGLSISQPGGDPNGSPTIRLRGLSTVGANTSPLVVIDGVIAASLETVDPNDIASIDVLKDGSAAAIYGSRASAGVIIVTTKRGTAGKTAVEYNVYGTMERIGKEVPVASADEFLRLRGLVVSHLQPGFSASQVDSVVNTYNKGANTDWMEQITRNAMSHVHNLSLSGGIGGTTYRAAVNYRDIQGIGITTGFSQLNGRLNLSQKALNDRLTLGLNLSATDRKSNFGFAEAFKYATLYNPTAPVRFSENANDPAYDPTLSAKYGGYFQAENFDYFNPVAILEQGINEGSQKDLLLNIRGDYELIEGLTASVSYSQNRENDLYGQFYPNNAYFRGLNDAGRASRTTNDREARLFEVTGRYDLDFGNNTFSFLGGYSHQQFTNEGFGALSRNFLSNATGYNNLGFGQRMLEGDPEASSSYKDQYRVIGFFGRANLNIDDTYYLSASVRREGSSRFGTENQWGIFPAVSAGLDITKLAELGGVDQLKLRLAYGVTGSLPPSSYLSQLLYSRQGSFFYNGDYVPAYAPTRNANADLKWEQKGEFDAGLDFALMDYKLTGTFDYYNRRTTDLIYFVPVPVPPNLAPNTWANLEDVALKSTGVELSIGYTHTTSSFTWEPRVNFATYTTTLDTISADDATYRFFQGSDPVTYDFTTAPGAPGQNNDPTIAIFGGGELGQIFAPVYEGILTQADVDAGLPVNHPAVVGGWKFRDFDGNDTLDIGVGGADRAVVGNGLPDFSLGFQNTFTFGNLDVSFFLRGDFGHSLVNMYRNFYESLGNAISRPIENTVTTDEFDESLFGAPLYSSYAVEKADYVVLDNATIGYNLGLSDGKKLRLYLTGRNLFYITNYQGVDPSVRYSDGGDPDNGGFASGNQNPLAPGLDRRNTYFRTYSVSLGANLNF